MMQFIPASMEIFDRFISEHLSLTQFIPASMEVFWSFTQFTLRVLCTLFYAMVVLTLAPRAGASFAVLSAHCLVVVASRFSLSVHGPDCRIATSIAFSAVTSLVLSPSHGLMILCFSSICPEAWLGWPPKKEKNGALRQ